MAKRKVVARKTVVKAKPKAKTASVKKKAPKQKKIQTAESWKRAMLKLKKSKN